MEVIKKEYKTLNIVFLGICIYLICFPVISKLLENIIPSLFSCPYFAITGEQCPLCGGTRFLRNISNVFDNFRYICNFFGNLLVALILETMFRIYNVMRKEYTSKIIIWDIIIHWMFLLYIITYDIIFFVYK